jgi:hypothetical protein
VKKEFALVPMFNAQPEFVGLLRDLAVEAMARKGDIVRLGTGMLKKLDLAP